MTAQEMVTHSTAQMEKSVNYLLNEKTTVAHGRTIIAMLFGEYKHISNELCTMLGGETRIDPDVRRTYIDRLTHLTSEIDEAANTYSRELLGFEDAQFNGEDE